MDAIASSSMFMPALYFKRLSKSPSHFSTKTKKEFNHKLENRLANSSKLSRKFATGDLLRRCKSFSSFSVGDRFPNERTKDYQKERLTCDNIQTVKHLSGQKVDEKFQTEKEVDETVVALHSTDRTLTVPTCSRKILNFTQSSKRLELKERLTPIRESIQPEDCNCGIVDECEIKNSQSLSVEEPKIFPKNTAKRRSGVDLLSSGAPSFSIHKDTYEFMFTNIDTDRLKEPYQKDDIIESQEYHFDQSKSSLHTNRMKRTKYINRDRSFYNNQVFLSNQEVMFFQLTNHHQTDHHQSLTYKRCRAATVIECSKPSSFEKQIDEYRRNQRRTRSLNGNETKEKKLRTFAVFSKSSNFPKYQTNELVNLSHEEENLNNMNEVHNTESTKADINQNIEKNYHTSEESKKGIFKREWSIVSETNKTTTVDQESKVDTLKNRRLLKSYTLDETLLTGPNGYITEQAVTNIANQILSISPVQINNLRRLGSKRCIHRRRMMRKNVSVDFESRKVSCPQRLVFSERSSLCNSFEASPSTRRRRISVKSSHIRKQSCRAAPPRMRKRTLSSGSSPTTPRKENSSSLPRFQTDRPISSLSEVVIPSRRLSVAVSRKPSNTFQRRPVRRCSEPFLLDPVTLQNKWNSRKHSTSRNFVRRRLSSAGSNLPSSSKHKLQALAKDELLASLNVPLSGGVICVSPDTDIVEPESKVAEHESSEEDALEKEKTRRETKRLMIMEEILETEKNYISCLETLNEVFRNQLQGSNVITEKDLHSLFPTHLNDIKTSHSWFMNELEERMKNENWRGIIGDIFAKMTSASSNLLEMYTAYVNAFPKSISTLSKCTRSSQKFRKFLEDCYENPVVERLDLPSFLLSPVQRLPRYILLLRELSKYTDEEHPDKYFISEAMKEMESLISSLNSSIHSSMEFYSASDSRRKKMTRQFTSKKRKQRTSSALQKVSSKKTSVLSESRTSTEPDQGYCSFGEPKDESPEDEQVPTRKARASTWRGGKRSMSMVSAGSDDGKNGVIIRRKNESVIGRNMDSRKSWRRSLGAVFSQLWSKEEAFQANNNNNNNGIGKLRSTPSLIIEDIDIKSDSEENHNTTDGASGGGFKRKSSMARRKIAIVHTPPTNDDYKASDNADGDTVQHLNDMVRDASLDDDTLSSPTSLDFPVITSSVDGLHRRNSTASEKSSTSLRTPNSPLYFKRGKLRGSAGPVFKSIFQRNNSQKIKKTLSWDELNVIQHDEEKRQKRFSFRKNTRQGSSKEQLNLTSSVSESRISTAYKVSNKDSISISSEETVSSQTSNYGSVKEEENYHDNNNTTSKTPKEKKNKFMKTLKNIVGKR